jgi:replicative DNA helicase
MVTVDHIGLVSGEGRSRGGDLNRQAELSDAADVFLALAHELAVTVVVVTQLNRGVTQRADQRPVPSDIRDTDRIEQNADLLLMLHRDKDNHPDELNVAVPAQPGRRGGRVHADVPRRQGEGHVAEVEPVRRAPGRLTSWCSRVPPMPAHCPGHAPRPLAS